MAKLHELGRDGRAYRLTHWMDRYVRADGGPVDEFSIEARESFDAGENLEIDPAAKLYATIRLVEDSPSHERRPAPASPSTDFLAYTQPDVMPPARARAQDEESASCSDRRRPRGSL